jgi:hypothetical protein
MEKSHKNTANQISTESTSIKSETLGVAKPRPNIPTSELEPPRWLVLTLQILAYGIPLTFLAYVLYINYLPFGYEKTFTIDVGAEDDTDSSQPFYLEPSRDLSERMLAIDCTTYRELNGIANVIFKPDVVLKDAEITVSVEGDGVSIIPPYIDFNPNNYEWDYSWDIGKSVSEDLTGNAFVFDGEVTFNGRDTRLELPNSADLFETDPFTLYAEWTPKDSESNAQQIVGHFNWELWQNSDNVEFRVGRMNNATGTTYSIKYPIKNKEGFFNSFHSAVATYNPSENGYIALYLDNELVGITSIGSDVIWSDYSSYNLSIGKSKHNAGNFLTGNVYQASLTTKNITLTKSEVTFPRNNEVLYFIPLQSDFTATLKRIKLNATSH